MREVLIRVYSRLFVVMENGGSCYQPRMDTDEEVLVLVYSGPFVVVCVHSRSVS
jgi:hypothetical protein